MAWNPIPQNRAEGSVAYCIGSCKAMGYRYAALQAGYACFCGSRYGTYGMVSGNGCLTPCQDQTGDNCGGPQQNYVYEVGH